jgi:uncharacterized peroxidase-related enzyme
VQRLLRALRTDFRHAELPPAERAMLDYARKLTDRPQAMGEDDVARLREHGFDDRAIHDICSITAYFAFVNRVADGLGVELEPRFHER